jgi:hypothetical protein
MLGTNPEEKKHVLILCPHISRGQGKHIKQ